MREVMVPPYKFLYQRHDIYAAAPPHPPLFCRIPLLFSFQGLLRVEPSLRPLSRQIDQESRFFSLLGVWILCNLFSHPGLFGMASDPPCDALQTLTFFPSTRCHRKAIFTARCPV